MSKKRKPNKRQERKPTQQPKTTKIVQEKKTPPKRVKSKKSSSQLPTYWYWLGGILLFTFIIYAGSLQNGFVNWDDDSNIVNNPYVQNFDVVTIFTELYSNAYRPLTFFMFSLLVQIGGEASSFHFLSLVLHLFNVVLVFFIIKEIGKKDDFALIVAGLFSVHPMMVEAISWASALNDVMYAAFFLGGIWMYLKGRKSYWIYLMFILSLLTKPSAIVFPFVLLLLDWYKNGKLERQTLFQKLPLVGIAVAFAIISVIARNNATEVSQLSVDYSIIDRILFAFYGFGYYGLKLFAPFNLSAIHYFPTKAGSTLPMIYYLAPIASVLVILALVFLKKHRQALLFGIAFYVINLILVVQLIPFGRAVVAERYAYLPYIGLFFILAYFHSLASKNIKTYFNYALLGLGLFFGVLTFNRSMVWKDGVSLFDNIIEHYPERAMSYYNRGNEQNRQGNYQAAIDDFDKAISLDDKSASFYNNKANTYTMLAQHETAIPLYNKAIQLERNTANFRYNRGMALEVLKRMDEAAADFRKAIELDENYTPPHLRLGDYHFNRNQYNDARRYYTKCINANYEVGYCKFYIGVADFNLGSKETACQLWEEARQLGYARASEMIAEKCQ